MPRAALRAARASTSNTERDACDAFDPRDRPRREDRVGEDRDHVGRNDEDDDDEASSTATENGGDARKRVISEFVQRHLNSICSKIASHARRRRHHRRNLSPQGTDRAGNRLWLDRCGGPLSP